MAPQVNDPAPPGINNPHLNLLRNTERPVWSRGGTLVKRPPFRHYIPKHPFYYTSDELYDIENGTRVNHNEEIERFVAAASRQRDVDARRAFSAPHRRASRQKNLDQTATVPSLPGKKAPRPATSQTSARSFVSADHPEAVNWLSTPVPGIRSIQKYDLYRRAALDQKNSTLYHIRSGLLPKYMGYVPGLKFRYGSTFGMLTYNAKEVGVERSATWGGAVSLF